MSEKTQPQRLLEEITGACCAHRKVVYKRIEHEGGTCSDSWVCTDCWTRFWPQPKPSTGKWTAESVAGREAHKVLCDGAGNQLAYLLHGDAETISATHNAELDREKERFMQAYRDATEATVAKFLGDLKKGK